MFKIHGDKTGGGGFEAFFISTKLYYRILTPSYSNPTSGNNGVLLLDLKPNNWYYIGIEHEKNKSEKSALNVLF